MTKHRFSMLIAIFCIVAASWAALAQETEPGPDTSAAAAPAGEAMAQQGQPEPEPTTLWNLIQQGGWIMFPLGLLSAAAIGLAVYGFIAVRTDKMLRPDLVPPLQDTLGQLNIQDAHSICLNNPSMLTNILSAGLERISDGDVDVESMEKAMEEASVQETNAGMKPISYLSIIAQIAPMLGLLGTVSGMIKAFDKIGLGGMGKPEMLAADIGEAMVTTATGLIVGIPAMFLYFYLKSRYTTNLSQLTRVLGNLSHRVGAAARGVVFEPSAPAEFDEEEVGA